MHAHCFLALIHTVIQIIEDLRDYWTEEDIRRNIINKYSCGDTYDGYYDPDTIMKYP